MPLPIKGLVTARPFRRNRCRTRCVVVMWWAKRKPAQENSCLLISVINDLLKIRWITSVMRVKRDDYFGTDAGASDATNWQRR